MPKKLNQQVNNMRFFESKVPLIVGFCMLFTMLNTSANTRYNNSAEMYTWVSGDSAPVVEVFIKETSVFAKIKAKSTDHNNLELPAIELKHLNSRLFDEYKDHYILIQDFNSDTFQDIGVMKSIGYGGANRCYSIFEYQPAFYSFRSHASKTVCVK